MDHDVNVLKENGYRITTPRKHILKVLSTHPQTVQEIYEILKQKNIHIDVVTIYRALEVFQKLGVISSIQWGDTMVRYELKKDEDHHHHLICDNCGMVEDVSMKHEPFLAEINKETAFKIVRHNLEFFGFCKNCQ